MTILDKVIAAVTPDPTPEERAAARADAQDAASSAPWLGAVLQHHQQVEAAFEEVRTATDAGAQKQAEKRLATLLTGHSMAEEAVIYPALALEDQKGHAVEAYTEQSAAKLNLGILEAMAPLSEDYLDKLEHVRHAVALHVYQEESTWFLELARNADAPLQARLGARYLEEFERYMGHDASRITDRGTASQRTPWPLTSASGSPSQASPLASGGKDV
jgi:hemerythrin superfamily protein